MLKQPFVRPFVRPLQALMIAGLMALPMAASADRYEVSVGTTARHMHSTTVDAIAANDRHAMFSMTIGAGIDQQLLGTGLQVEIGFEAGALAGQMYERMNTDTGLTTGTAGGRLRWALGSGFFGFGRAAIGVTRVSFELRDSQGSSYIRDRGYAGVFDAGGGVDFTLIPAGKRNHRFSLSLRADLGYTAASPVGLEAKPAAAMEEGAIIIPTTAADLGSLNLSSWNFRFGVVARF